MNLRWLLGNFADPQYGLSRRDQFRLSNLAHKRSLPTGAFLVRTLIIVAPFLAMFPLIKFALRRMGYGSDTLVHIAVYAMLLLVFWPWSAWMYRSLYLRPIRMAMRSEGHDLCLKCGYDLRGLPPDKTLCPECGEKREPMEPSK